MEKKKIYLALSILAIIIFLFGKLYLFNIYEVTYEVKPEKLYADNQSVVRIQAIPINAFGWKAPFRSAPADFEIKEGADLVYVQKNDKDNGTLIIKAKDKPGTVTIFVKSKYSMLPTALDIIIEPNAA
jgi:hypothetical protein